MIMSDMIYVLYYIIIEPPFQGFSIRVITKNVLSDLVPNTVKNMLTAARKHHHGFGNPLRNRYHPFNVPVPPVPLIQITLYHPPMS